MFELRRGGAGGAEEACPSLSPSRREKELTRRNRASSSRASSRGCAPVDRKRLVRRRQRSSRRRGHCSRSRRDGRSLLHRSLRHCCCQPDRREDKGVGRYASGVGRDRGQDGISADEGVSGSSARRDEGGAYSPSRAVISWAEEKERRERERAAERNEGRIGGGGGWRGRWGQGLGGPGEARVRGVGGEEL